ncbi:hypothetical protein Lalb_Chr05g0215251 [Lupinus albus]|uniref:Uncharacterized protein n=1 Tax=Lupinus albus TaxID=3870 RepID=A0A6A4QHN2_LUPAL|nr:hypothetical protein Lalb_Chr05g0215251 [Lupinus albus]
MLFHFLINGMMKHAWWTTFLLCIYFFIFICTHKHYIIYVKISINYCNNQILYFSRKEGNGI